MTPTKRNELTVSILNRLKKQGMPKRDEDQTVISLDMTPESADVDVEEEEGGEESESPMPEFPIEKRKPRRRIIRPE